ncbi:MAG: response regulator transcription factor, partial [Bacteroidota bacterium]
DLERQLQALEYEVVGMAASVDEALVGIEKQRPDLVLLDIHLAGGKPGTELGKMLRQEGEIPFIYITSYSDKATVEEAKMTRPNGYLLKPFSNDDIYVAIEIALNNFAHRTIDEQIQNEKLQEKAPKRINLVVAFIQDNLDQKLTLPLLAEQSGWNMYHFARLFKKYLDTTPHQYILKARMERAQVLLTTSSDSILQIAQQLGYDSHSHFTQAFRKTIGITPNAFRRKKSTIR